MNKITRVTYNLNRQCQAIIKKYGFKAAVADIVYRDWLPTPCPEIVHKGYTVLLGLECKYGKSIALIHLGENPKSMRERRQAILDCLSTYELAIETDRPQGGIN